MSGALANADRMAAGSPAAGASATPYRNISIHARGTTLAAIDALAAAEGCKAPKAAMLLIERALADRSDRNAPTAPALVNLETVSTDDLIDEVVGRLQRIGELELAEARAAAAEAKLLAVASAIGGGAS